MKITVTIPAYNEEKTIGAVIHDLHKVMKAGKHDYSVLVVDDGSDDRTVAVAKKAGAVVVSHPVNLGLARTFRTEMRECLKMGSDVIIHTDADGQYLASDIPRLLDKIAEGNDLVLGSRFKGKIEKMSFIKRMGNRAFSKVVRNIAGIRLSDGQTGFRAFTREVAAIEIRSTFTYTQEQIIRAARAGFRIAEVPIYFAKRGGNTESRLMRNPFDFALKAGLNLLRTYRDYEPLKFFGSFGLSLMGLSFLLGIYIIVQFLSDVAVIDRQLPTIMLIVLLFTSGLQIMLFGFLADQRKI